MPWHEMWLPPAAGEGAVAAGLFLDGADAAAHGALLAAMPGCSLSFGPRHRRRGAAQPPGFLSLTMSVKGGRGFVPAPVGLLSSSEEKAGAEESDALVAGKRAVEVAAEAEGVILLQEKEKDDRAGAGAMNMTKHLWAGAVAAMVSRYSRIVWFTFIRLLAHSIVFGFHVFIYIVGGLVLLQLN
jgi:hypothetical protein